jgi:hypothetical protein
VQSHRRTDRWWLKLFCALHYVAAGHALKRRQVRELIPVGLARRRIDEQRRAILTASALQRQRDQVPETAPRQIILRWEEAVVALYVHLAADRHRLV